MKIRQEKRAQRLSFWVQRPPGGVGVFHAKGWWPKTSCPPSKLCLPWVSKRGIRDVPGILPGCPGPLAVFKKFVQKNFVRIFRSLEESIHESIVGMFCRYCSISWSASLAGCGFLVPSSTRIHIEQDNFIWKKGKDPHPQDKIQHLDFTKDPRPLYYKTAPCVVYHKSVRSKAVFGP